MGIFDKNEQTIKSVQTKDFYFGAPEAEGEILASNKLTDYFEDYLDILRNLKQGKFIFTGRKGVGKSAIAKYIKDESDSSDDSFATILRISDFDIEAFIQKPIEGFQTEKLLFEWLILVNIVKLIVNNNCGHYTDEYTKLKRFLEKNSGLISVDKFQVDEQFKKSGGEINFGILTHAFGGVFKNYFDVKTTRAPFYKIIPPLKDIVKLMLDYPVNKELEFWLLFDDLDINYDLKNESDNFKIIELLRLAKLYNTEIFVNNKAKILVFLREDIRENLISKYSDSAKIFASYEIFINWYNLSSASSDENSISLKQMINKRIEINFKNHGISFGNDPWYSLFSSESYGNKSSFKYVLDFTFYRPRDMITFLTTISQENYNFPIGQYYLKKLLKKYIGINILEIKSELSLYFTEFEKDKIFNILFHFISNNSGITYKEIIEKIDNLEFAMEAEKVFEILYSYSLIVYQNKDGELYFSYRENIELDRLNKNQLTVTLPKCIYHHYKEIY